MPSLGQVEVDHSGLDVGMAEVALDQADVNALIEQMGSVGVAQGVNRDVLFINARPLERIPQSALHGGDSHWGSGLSHVGLPASRGREKQGWMPMSAPVDPQNR